MIIPNQDLKLIFIPEKSEVKEIPVSQTTMKYFLVDDPDPTTMLIFQGGDWYQVSKSQVVVGQHEEKRSTMYHTDTILVNDCDPTYVVHKLGQFAPESVQEDDPNIWDKFLTNDFTRILTPEAKVIGMIKILSGWKDLDKDEMARMSKIVTDGQVTLVPDAQGESWCPKIKATSESGTIITLYDWSDTASQVLVALAMNYDVLRQTVADSETAQE